MNPLAHWAREGPIDIVDGREWGSGAGQFRLVTDGAENRRQGLDHLIVGEAHHKPAQRLDGLLAMVIVELPFIPSVDRTIEFNDQLQGHTGEVGEVAVDRVLTAESQTIEPAGAEMLPEKRFCVGLTLTQIARAGGPGFGRHAA